MRTHEVSNRKITGPAPTISMRLVMLVFCHAHAETQKASRCSAWATQWVPTAWAQGDPHRSGRGVFPPLRLPGGCRWPALQLCALRGVLGYRTHSEGHVRCNFRLGKSSCCVCGLLASVSLASDRESGAKAESCFVDSSGTRS